MKYILAMIILLAHWSIGYPQIETIIWQQCLGTHSEICNKPNAVETTGSGYMFGISICAVGPGVSNYHGGGDAWIVSTDFSGTIIWERCYGGSDGEIPVKIISINDSLSYLLNSSNSIDGDVQNGRPGNFWVVKINQFGNIIWENSYGGSAIGEEVRDAILMPDNGLLLMGRISSTGGDITTHYGNMDIWFCRIDSTGGIIWEKTYGNQARDNALKIKLTNDNTVLMIGGHYESGGMIDCPEMGTDGADVWIVEMDLHGSMLNQWCYGGSHDDLGRDIIKMTDGYVFAANTNSDDGDVSGFHGPAGENEYSDYWIVKISLTGNIIWQKCLGGYSWEYPVYISETADSGFVVIGNTNSHDGDVTGNHITEWNELDIWIVKLNSDGQLLWENCYGGLGTDRFWGIHSVLKKDDFNFVLGANSDYASDDVTCDLFPNTTVIDNAWLFEIKDCNYYSPEIPVIYSGPDTLCSTDSINVIYRINPSTWAWDYEWSIIPEEAGTLQPDSLSVEVTWNPAFEGPVEIKARSYNDCGYSEWSEPHVTRVYTCLGVDEQGGMGAWGHGGMEIFPNPASGEMLNVECLMLNESENYKLSIYDIFGRMAPARQISSPRMGGGREGSKEGEGVSWIVNVKELPPGIYLAVIREKTTVVASGKFVVAR